MDENQYGISHKMRKEKDFSLIPRREYQVEIKKKLSISETY